MSNWNHVKMWNTRFCDGLGMEVRQWNEKKPEELDHWDFPCFWNTYLLLSDRLKFSKLNEKGETVLCEPYREEHPWVSYLWENRKALHSIDGWNGGPTFEEFTVDSTGQRRIKVGDDYQHLWDHENRQFRNYNLEYMQRRIQHVAQEAFDLLMNATGHKPTPPEEQGK